MAGYPKELNLAEADLVAFAGPNADTYLDYLRKCRAAGKFRMGFIWTAFFTTAIWLAYRKLWLWLFVSIGISFGLPEILPTGGAGVATGIGIAFAMMGKSLVVKGAWKAAQKADEEGLKGEGRRSFLRRKGGVSTLAAIIASIVVALAVAIVIIAIANDDTATEAAAPSSRTEKSAAPASGEDPFDNIYKPQSEKKSAPPDWLRHSVE
ncbi:hypothetical protein FHS78_000404 [Parvibaculum indicum]|uniref:DUF2628 domain-containing protein n=1 Tax=Parvibaculum indicum TaxID=562969 RepID=UPI001424049A|nr:DUF2628 domain-containing protein [Parvibaculum indicum]NIJ40149.1 hypothetical protein [Parvibaculum indicum]